MCDLITIIIPVYNVENFLDECIKNIVNQTYKNLEIIIINDGSTDKSLEIMNSYKEKDKRIKIISKKNEGVSCARNEGIKYINGEFVIFIDSDDYLEKNMLEKLYFYANNFEADMVICNYNMVKDNNIVRRKNEFNYNGILDKEEFFKKIFMPQYFSGYLWNKLIRSDIIIKNSILFEKDIHMMEDLLFVIKIAELSEKIYWNNNLKLYNYIQRSNGAMRKNYNMKTVTALKVYEQIIPYVEKYNKSYINFYKYNYLFCAMKSKKVLKDNNKLNSEEKKYIKIIRKKCFWGAMYCKQRSMQAKIKLAILCISPKIYEKILEKIKK